MSISKEKLERFYEILKSDFPGAKYTFLVDGVKVSATSEELCALYHTDPERFETYVVAIVKLGEEAKELLKDRAPKKNVHVYHGETIAEVRDKLILDECEALADLKWSPRSAYNEIMDAFDVAHGKLDAKESEQ